MISLEILHMGVQYHQCKHQGMHYLGNEKPETADIFL